jgi:hypothetical protein
MICDRNAIASIRRFASVSGGDRVTRREVSPLMGLQ